jgi:hypothetical protein
MNPSDKDFKKVKIKLRHKLQFKEEAGGLKNDL